MKMATKTVVKKAATKKVVAKSKASKDEFQLKKIGAKVIANFKGKTHSTTISKEGYAILTKKVLTYNRRPSITGEKAILKMLSPKAVEKARKEERIEAEIKGYKKLIKKNSKEGTKERGKVKMTLKKRADKSTSEGKDFIQYAKNGIVMKGFENIVMPSLLVSKIQQFLEQNISIKPLLNFWSLCLLNPNEIARTRLFEYLTKHRFIITPSGYFVTYRLVKSTNDKDIFTDAHTHSMKIKIGEIVSIPRVECDEDGSKDCSRGLHVGSPDFIGISKGEGYNEEKGQIGTGYVNYSPNFGDQPIIAFINPRHVVSIPDSETRKLRCCEYYPFKLTTPQEVIHVEDSSYFVFEGDYKKLEFEQLISSINKSELKEFMSDDNKNSENNKILKAKLEERRLLIGNDIVTSSLTLEEMKNIVKNRLNILGEVYPSSIQL